MAKPSSGPVLLTANRLIDGEVVYFAADGAWTARIEQAAVAHTPEALADLTTRAAQSRAVVDVAAIGVDLSLRERIRRVGPTVRPDLARPDLARVAGT